MHSFLPELGLPPEQSSVSAKVQNAIGDVMAFKKDEVVAAAEAFAEGSETFVYDSSVAYATAAATTPLARTPR